jgi:hypothetical protein
MYQDKAFLRKFLGKLKSINFVNCVKNIMLILRLILILINFFDKLHVRFF